MKKVLSIALALVFALSTFSVLVFAADEPVITFSADKTEAKVGDTVTVKAVVSKDSGLCAAKLAVEYDKDCFKVKEVKAGGFANTEINSLTEGKILLAATNPQTGIKDEAEVLTVELEVKKTEGNISFKVREAAVATGDDELGSMNVTESVAAASDKSVVIACAHAEFTEKITKEPGCTEKGVKEFTCTQCDHVKTEEINALGHKEGEWETVKEPTAQEAGKKVKKCTVCGDVLAEEEIKKLVLGDVDGDGKIMAVDARKVLQYCANLIELDEVQLNTGDVNEDGVVDLTDARWILQYMANLREF